MGIFLTAFLLFYLIGILSLAYQRVKLRRIRRRIHELEIIIEQKRKQRQEFVKEPVKKNNTCAN